MIDPIEAPAMKLPRVRFTVWRMMVAVSAFAFLIWGGVLTERSVRAGRLARQYRQEVASLAEDERRISRMVSNAEAYLADDERFLADLDSPPKKQEFRSKPGEYRRLKDETKHMIDAETTRLGYLRETVRQTTDRRRRCEQLAAEFTRSAFWADPRYSGHDRVGLEGTWRDRNNLKHFYEFRPDGELATWVGSQESYNRIGWSATWRRDGNRITIRTDRNWDFEGQLGGVTIRGKVLIRDGAGAVVNRVDEIWQKD
jgi:hypothetical protein